MGLDREVGAFGTLGGSLWGAAATSAGLAFVLASGAFDGPATAYQYY